MSKIWAFLVLVGGVLLGVLQVFSMGKKSATNEIKAESEEKAREVEKLGAEATISGLEKERKIRDEKIDTTKRDHFNS